MCQRISFFGVGFKEKQEAVSAEWNNINRKSSSYMLLNINIIVIYSVLLYKFFIIVIY